MTREKTGATARGRSPEKIAPAKIEVVIEDDRWRADPATLVLIRRAARLALTLGVGEKSVRRCSPKDPVVTILLSSDTRLKALNTRFRAKRKASNVLSFPSADPDYLGDIAIAYGVVAREARRQNKALSAHAAHMAVHGVLHLTGYDHQDAREAGAMEALERRILSRLGLTDPYAETGKAA